MSNATNLLVSALIDSFSTQSTDIPCLKRYSKARCYITNFGHRFTYILLAFALLPQIIHLFKHRHRYIAGVSYQWIIIRSLALTSLMVSYALGWSFIGEFLALISTITIFCQIVMFSNSLHRQNKIILAIAGLFIWILGRIAMHFLVKREYLLLTIGYVLFGIQMLPQILLNSLLRTTKALSKFSILLCVLSDLFLFISFPPKHTPSTHLIAIYYSFSCLLYICFQYLIHSDDHIHLISRSTHTVLTPGVDIFTGLDTTGKRSSGEDPQMFSVEHSDPMDDDDVIYQAVTTNKVPRTTTEPMGLQRCIWYAASGCIFCIETLLTIVLIYRVGSPWIIFAPLSILIILAIFFLLRTRLNAQQLESLRKIL